MDVEPVETPHASRAPQQGRSRASYERMLAAAEALLVERGSDDFTLTEVSRVGKVSIGSIYCRFDSKDDLIRAVQVRALDLVNQEQLERLERAAQGAGDLYALVISLVDSVAETLRKHGPIMRPLMLRAASDPVVAMTGKGQYKVVADRVHALLLARRDEIAHADAERAVQSVYRIIYASLARYLGFGTAVGATWEGDWAELKEDLGRMCAVFLLTPPR